MKKHNFAQKVLLWLSTFSVGKKRAEPETWGDLIFGCLKGLLSLLVWAVAGLIIYSLLSAFFESTIHPGLELIIGYPGMSIQILLAFAFCLLVCYLVVKIIKKVALWLSEKPKILNSTKK